MDCEKPEFSEMAKSTLLVRENFFSPERHLLKVEGNVLMFYKFEDEERYGLNEHYYAPD